MLLAVVTVVASGVVSLAVALYVGRRDARRRERVTFLLNAYRVLSDAAHRPLTDNARQFEQALSDVGLLGEVEQVNLAADLAHTFASTGGADLDPLLASLRDALRRELGLPRADADVPVLRITGGSAPDES